MKRILKYETHLRPVLSQKKAGTIFRYDFVAGGQIVPQKYLCDRTAKDTFLCTIVHKKSIANSTPPQKKAIAFIPHLRS